MRAPTLDAKGRKLLELLAEGLSARQMARKLGLTEGTVRVYLHQLYRMIGVRNRTQAVIWHLAGQPPAAAPPQMDEGFGDVALREGLLSALGIMESFVGPYSRVWEAGMRLQGSPIDPATQELRLRVRLLWRALLRGDFAFGKRLYDQQPVPRPDGAAVESLLLAMSLLLGGFSRAADEVLGRLPKRRKGALVLAHREVMLLRSLRDYLNTGREEALMPLRQASEGATAAALKPMASVALFHASRASGDPARARAEASDVWAEADEARRQLEAMGWTLGKPAVRTARAGLQLMGPGARRARTAATP